MSLRKNLARNLRQLRSERSLSQEKLAFETDIDRSYVSLLENSRFSATIDLVEKIAKGLKIKPLDLLADPIKSKRSK